MAHVTAAFDQRTYRFRNDDGSESGATWKAAENTDISQATGEVFRLRVAVQETAGGGANNQTIVLQSNINGGGWNNVGPTSPGVRLGQSPHVNDQTPTTRQLGGTSGTFRAGLLLTATSGTDISFQGNDHTEVEWASLLITGDVPDGATVGFRVTIGGAVADTVTAAPSLTAEHPEVTDAPALTSPSKTDSSIQLEWTAVDGADTYELQRNEATIQNTTSLSRNDSGLDPDTAYDYRVRGVNDAGPGPWSTVLNVTTEPEPEPDWTESDRGTADATLDDPAPDAPEGGSTATVTAAPSGSGVAEGADPGPDWTESDRGTADATLADPEPGEFLRAVGGTLRVVGAV